MKLALLQLHSGAQIAANIARIGTWVAQAAAQGAELIATPENSFAMDATGTARSYYTQDTHPGILAAQGWAKRHGVWILLGSVAVLPTEETSKKTYNRSLLINPQGTITALYDKIHLFDVDVPNDRSYRESDRVIAGTKRVVADGAGARIGLSICYDLRFPELYRQLAKAGANIIAVPAAFTAVTGEAHWHVLLRARAIENGCFVIAPAQTGTHDDGRRTYGHSLVVDPWGRILADGGETEGIVMADIDMSEVARVRAQIPSLQQDRR